MKKAFSLLPFCCLFFVAASYATTIKPSSILPVSLQDMPLKNFLQLSGKEFSVLTGKHLSMEQRITFGMVRSSMKKAVRKNPAITAGEFFASKKKMKGWLKVVLIVLGVFLLAFIIFAFAYGAGQE